jgi:tetratricopeptide (TPR) repeat protein
MHDKEITLFANGLKFAQDEFFLDSINEFNKLVEGYPDSELADDALYNIGLCYFSMQQFEKAIRLFDRVITDYPDATISILDGGNEFGKTAAKCHYAIVNCYLAINELDNAKKELDKLKIYTASYILVEEKKTKFYQYAERAINIYIQTNS